MSRRDRNFFPQKIVGDDDVATGTTTSTGSNCGSFPPAGLVEPTDFPPPRGTQPAQVTAKITAGNNLSIWNQVGQVDRLACAGHVRFQTAHRHRVATASKMNNHSSNLAPNLETLLEDARTRGDRLHPFWAKFECSTGRAMP